MIKGGLLGATLARNKGLFAAAAQGAQVAAPEKRKPPAFFGEGGAGRGIAGHIGDAMLQMSGMQPIYAPTMMARQGAMADERQAQLARVQGMEDYRAKKEIDREYDMPDKTPYEKALDAAGIVGDERMSLLRRKAENDAAGVPVAVDVTNPDGSVTRQYVRPGQAGGGQGPARPVGKLRPMGGQRDSAGMVRKKDAAVLRQAYGEAPYQAWLKKFGLWEEQ